MQLMGVGMVNIRVMVNTMMGSMDMGMTNTLAKGDGPRRSLHHLALRHRRIWPLQVGKRQGHGGRL